MGLAHEADGAVTPDTFTDEHVALSALTGTRGQLVRAEALAARDKTQLLVPTPTPLMKVTAELRGAGEESGLFAENVNVVGFASKLTIRPENGKYSLGMPQLNSQDKQAPRRPIPAI